MPQADTATDPTIRIRQMLREIVDEVRADVKWVDNPKEQALFETTAEVLLGLVKAYEDFDRGDEAAWK
jgi:hypothetical protein